MQRYCQTRQNVVNDFLINKCFVVNMKFSSASPKLSMRSCEKLVDNKKRIDSFLLFRRTNPSMKFSDLPLFLINNMRYEFVAVFQNSHKSQKIVDKKESSTRKSCQQHLVLCVYSLKFVSIVTVKVCVCSSPHSKQKCYHKKNETIFEHFLL